MILFSANKTAKWLREKSPSERKDLLQRARLCAPEFKKMYQVREQQVYEQRAKILQSKQETLARLQQKALQLKENLTNDLMVYGLWQNEDNVD